MDPAKTERESLRCAYCQLVQYVSRTRKCVRCRRPYLEIEAEEECLPVGPCEAPRQVCRDDLRNVLATQILALRMGRGISQRMLAAKMRVPRTYVSKIENRKVLPTIENVQKIANVFEVPISQLLGESQVAALLRDPVIAEILPILGSLSLQARIEILRAAKSLSKV